MPPRTRGEAKTPAKRAPAKKTTAKSVSDKSPTAKDDSTPIADEVAKELTESGKIHYDEVVEKTAEKIVDSDKVHYDETDVEAALARETHDGKGDEDPGPSDWISYATEGVEREDAS